MVSGLIVGAAFAGFYNWASGVYSYNRDAWMTDIQVEQAHHYQKDNLQIQMQAMRRDEVRDLVNSDINRINSSLLVATLILSLAGEMLFEGQIPTDCPPFVLNAYMLCLGSAVFYLTLSILSGIIASNTAYRKAARLLVHYIRPRWKQHFQQLRQRQAHENTACFESKPVGEMMLPPLAGRMWRSFRRKNADKSDNLSSPKAVPHSLSDMHKKNVERFYSFEESSPDTSSRKNQPSFLRGCCKAESRSMGKFLADEDEADSEDDLEDRQNLQRAKRKWPVQWYVKFWHDPNHEWQKYCNCMFLSVARGTTNLVEACGYLAVGTLYGGYAEAWAFWAVQMLFSVINVMVVRFLIGKFERPERDSADKDWRDWLLKPNRPFLLAFVVASGPLWCVIAAATSFEMLDRFLIPTCYGTHTVVNMYFVWWLDHMTENMKPIVEEEEEESSEDQLELGGVGVRNERGPRPRRPKEKGGLSGMMMLSLGTLVISAFWMFALIWALHGAFYGMDFRNSKAAVSMWQDGPPLLEVSATDMASPSPFWSPHALVFIADRYRVYELKDNKSTVVVYPCSVNGTIADISSTCDATHCWPIILVHGTPPLVVDCKSGVHSPLLQSSGEAQRIATSRNASASTGALRTLVATMSDKVISQYGWSMERDGWQPLWDIQESVGVLALDLVDNRLLIFYRGGFLQAKDIRTGGRCGRWALPSSDRIIGGGCGNKETDSMLLLAKSHGGAASQLLRAELPSMKDCGHPVPSHVRLRG